MNENLPGRTIQCVPHSTRVAFTFNCNSNRTKNSTFPNYIPIINCNINLLDKGKRLYKWHVNYKDNFEHWKKQWKQVCISVCQLYDAGNPESYVHWVNLQFV